MNNPRPYAFEHTTRSLWLVVAMWVCWLGLAWWPSVLMAKVPQHSAAISTAMTEASPKPCSPHYSDASLCQHSCAAHSMVMLLPFAGPPLGTAPASVMQPALASAWLCTHNTPPKPPPKSWV